MPPVLTSIVVVAIMHSIMISPLTVRSTLQSSIVSLHNGSWAGEQAVFNIRRRSAVYLLGNEVNTARRRYVHPPDESSYHGCRLRQNNQYDTRTLHHSRS